MIKPVRLLLLGGTTEATEIARILSELPNVSVIFSLAGRVRKPIVPKGEFRIGGFGGVEALREFLVREEISAVIDATHPYAVRMTAHAQRACGQIEIPYLSVVRSAWRPVFGDQWHVVKNVGEAATIATRLADRIFLTVWRQEITTFADYTDPWFLIRSIDPPLGPLPPRHELLLQRGPFSLVEELRILNDYRITIIVSKNSGGIATYAKIEAARMLSIPVVLIDRPAPVPGATVDTVSAAKQWIYDVVL